MSSTEKQPLLSTDEFLENRLMKQTVNKAATSENQLNIQSIE